MESNHPSYLGAVATALALSCTSVQPQTVSAQRHASTLEDAVLQDEETPLELPFFYDEQRADQAIIAITGEIHAQCDAGTLKKITVKCEQNLPAVQCINLQNIRTLEHLQNYYITLNSCFIRPQSPSGFADFSQSGLLDLPCFLSTTPRKKVTTTHPFDPAILNCKNQIYACYRREWDKLEHSSD